MADSAAAATKALVIVESPTKARTIRKFLGDQYVVEASMGHVRDLPSSASELPASVKGQPWARLAVNVDEGFEPVYVVPSDKKKIVTELKRALKDADVLYIATDEDREGEAIGWHLVQLLKPKVPTHRLVFHEITKTAIDRALATPRELDQQLVSAQEARRVLDRLVGYVVSPLLWVKVARGLSAGRVQSVAVRLLVLRERERMAFIKADWWDLKATLRKNGIPFDATLTSIDGQSIATGRDFDETTGKLRAERDVMQLSETEARALETRLADTAITVESLKRKVQQRRPYPPFTTSTLQQEANRKLGLGASRTMQIAQKLYENGHITYMRTDSFNLSDDAISGIRKMVGERYGDRYLSEKARRFTTKSKGAQEAHEAIRPAGNRMATSQELGLSGLDAKVYDLIWKRTVSTQMAEAQIALTTANLTTKDPETGRVVNFRASGREVLFPGFLRAYVEGSDDPEAVLDNRDQPLPELVESETVSQSSMLAQGHETRPPSRFTEAALVKALETKGIGRPSTYASIIETIQRRGYVQNQNKQLTPTFTAMVVTQLLEQTLGQVVDTEFTASMEAWLDEIAVGGSAQEYLDNFYRKQLVDGVAQGGEINPRQICTLERNDIAPYKIRLGKFGPFVEVPAATEGEKGASVSLPEDLAPADVSLSLIEELKARSEQGEMPIGTDPETGLSVYVRSGRFGPFIQLGEVTDEQPKPKRASLPPKMDTSEVTFEVALSILSLPRVIGKHPEDGADIKAGIGRYGPYVHHGRVYASLTAADDVLTVGYERGLELLALKAQKSKKSAALKELGEHPEEGGLIAVMDGRYGPYVKHGRINATLPEGVKPDAVTLEEAVALIAAKAAKKGKAKRTTRTKAKTSKSKKSS